MKQANWSKKLIIRGKEHVVLYSKLSVRDELLDSRQVHLKIESDLKCLVIKCARSGNCNLYHFFFIKKFSKNAQKRQLGNFFSFFEKQNRLIAT